MSQVIAPPAGGPWARGEDLVVAVGREPCLEALIGGGALGRDVFGAVELAGQRRIGVLERDHPAGRQMM